jgi:predicted metal-dependent peptidase
LETLKKDLKLLTAEKIYVYLKQTKSNPRDLAELRAAFYADNHELWYMTSDEIEARFGISFSENGCESRLALAEMWDEIAERMQVDMETFGKKRGFLPGAMTQNLAAVNREKYDYTAFLKKFAVMGEAMKTSEDEFDYIFYTYGLQLYEKMPLVEPLEYKEVKAIKEFVVAIDTSGSTSGELVQKFVQKTYNILKSTESFFSKINLHIVQCDADVQEDKKITCAEDFDEYLKTMKIRGLGGTDFRPVFEYVEKLRKNKEFTNLKGLIYFTDGHGAFPAKKPDYETAFVFVDDDYNNYDVPPWAIKLILQKDEI